MAPEKNRLEAFGHLVQTNVKLILNYKSVAGFMKCYLPKTNILQHNSKSKDQNLASRGNFG